jgi:hypothetical protein
MKLVKIDWVDSIQPNGEWQYLSEFKVLQPINCVSVGYLICNKKEVKALAQNIGDMDNKNNIQASGIIHIPTKSIKKIKEIKI